MELAIHVQLEELPEGVFLATSDQLPGLTTGAETLEIARDVASKIIEARCERNSAGRP